MRLRLHRQRTRVKPGGLLLNALHRPRPDTEESAA